VAINRYDWKYSLEGKAPRPVCGNESTAGGNSRWKGLIKEPVSDALARAIPKSGNPAFCKAAATSDTSNSSIINELAQRRKLHEFALQGMRNGSCERASKSVSSVASRPQRHRLSIKTGPRVSHLTAVLPEAKFRWRKDLGTGKLAKGRS